MSSPSRPLTAPPPPSSTTESPDITLATTLHTYLTHLSTLTSTTQTRITSFTRLTWHDIRGTLSPTTFTPEARLHRNMTTLLTFLRHEVDSIELERQSVLLSLSLVGVEEGIRVVKGRREVFDGKDGERWGVIEGLIGEFGVGGGEKEVERLAGRMRGAWD